MMEIILTILLVGAFFILFFKPQYTLKNKKEEEEEVVKEEVTEASSTVGFVEDTGLETFGAVFEEGDMGTFVPYSTIPDDNWLSGSPHLKETVEA
jgi:hypothetical protein